MKVAWWGIGWVQAWIVGDIYPLSSSLKDYKAFGWVYTIHEVSETVGEMCTLSVCKALKLLGWHTSMKLFEDQIWRDRQ